MSQQQSSLRSTKQQAQQHPTAQGAWNACLCQQQCLPKGTAGVARWRLLWLVNSSFQHGEAAAAGLLHQGKEGIGMRVCVSSSVSIRVLQHLKCGSLGLGLFASDCSTVKLQQQLLHQDKEGFWGELSRTPAGCFGVGVWGRVRHNCFSWRG